MTVDAERDLESVRLSEWRDAAGSGQLPAPSRSDRWQPLRAGLVNLWEYDTAEVWYADGRLQLQGANESGKSTLMTLTTLILLTGDISSYNIDTLGESGKRFRYYVEPTSHPLDRRETNDQKSRGWAWAEYGRLTEQGPEFFTTLVFAESRRADAQLKLQWCTLHGEHRVRDGLSLATAGMVTEPGGLREVRGMSLHRSGTAYREEIARTLFGSDASWLDQVIRILRVVRTPKIGDRLNLQFLTEAFRAALPPLAEDEIHQLADGWEQLERMRTERDTTEQALAAISEFTRQRWQPWADAVIRAAADPVIAATSALDRVTRDERGAKEAVDDLSTQAAGLEENVAHTSQKRETAAAERDALRQRREYKDAASAVADAARHAEEARRLADLADRTAFRAKGAEAAVAPAQARLDSAKGRLEEAGAAVESAAGQVAHHSETAGLVEPTARFLPARDTDRLQHAASRRQEAVIQTLRLLQEQRACNDRLEVATAKQTAATTEERRAQTETAEAGQQLEATIHAVGDLVTEWVARLEEPIRPMPALVESWLRDVAALGEMDMPAPVLVSAIGRDHLGPTRRPLDVRKVELDGQLETIREHRATAESALTAVKAETEPHPSPPTLWARRPRPDGITELGAPLWRLVEVADGVEQAQVATVEAALEAAGLLQAFVTPDGAYTFDRDGHETVWAVTSASHADAEGTLSAILRPADDAGDLAPVVERLLRSVAYGPSLAEVSHAIGTDGRWRHGELLGSVAAGQGGPRLLGAAARAADRSRRISELTDRLDELSSEHDKLRGLLNDVESSLVALTDAAERMPSDTLVVSAVLTLAQKQGRAAELAEAARMAAEDVRDERAVLDQAAAATSRHTDEHGLPRAPAQVESVLTAIHEYRGSVRDLDSAIAYVPALQEAVSDAVGAVADARKSSDELAADAASDRRAAEQARTKAAAAQAALSRDGQQLLLRFDELGRQIANLDHALKEVTAELTALNEALIKAEGKLEQIGERREDAEADRQGAVDSWYACIDHGLPRLRDVPDPPARHVTAALESARTARALVTPRDWPDEPVAAGHRVQNRWSQMVDSAVLLRSRLEPLGGRTVRTVPVGEGEETFPGAVEVVVDGTGAAQSPPTAVTTLATLLGRLQTDYDEELTKTINQLLGSTFIEHLRDRLVEAEQLRVEINAKLAKNPTSTSGLTLRMIRFPVSEERAANEVLTALERGFALLPEATQTQVRQFLTARVNDAQEAARAAGDPDWRSRLAEILDYRRWFELRMEYRAPSGDGVRDNWRRLDRDDHSLLSGGAKVVTLLQPFVAALHAMYDQSGVGPRMMWLDEAFNGVDPDNRATMLRLLTSCDLDWLIAGPGPIANASTVPMAAMYEVRRAPRPFPGVCLELSVWSGNELTHVATPDPADLPDIARLAEAKDATDVDLFSLPDSSDS